MRIVLLLMVLMMAFASCRSTKQITTVIAKKDSAVVVVNPAESDSAKTVRATLDKIKAKKISFTTFSSKVKVEYSDDKNRRFDFNAFVRMKKDSAIWISIIAALNIEAFRVMITPHSIVIMDKINRTIQRKPLLYLQEITKAIPEGSARRSNNYEIFFSMSTSFFACSKPESRPSASGGAVKFNCTRERVQHRQSGRRSGLEEHKKLIRIKKSLNTAQRTGSLNTAQRTF